MKTVEDPDVLPDILDRGLDVVFVGSAVGTVSAAAGHYYANPRNAIWQRIKEAGLTPTQLRAVDDGSLPAFGVGLTDLNKSVAQSDNAGLDYDHQRFLDRVIPFKPAIVAFNGKDHTEDLCRFLGERFLGFGRQNWSIGESVAYVVPNSSGRVYDAMPC